MVPYGFQQIYEGVCQVLGVPTQVLECDEHGQLGFGMHLGEIHVQVAAAAWLAPQAQVAQDGLLLMIEFAAPGTPPGPELLEGLLDANLLLGAAGGPVFCRNPVDGSLLLLQALPLAGLSGEQLHGLALRLARLAEVWRSGATEMPGSQADDPANEALEKDPASRRRDRPFPAPQGGLGPTPAYA